MKKFLICLLTVVLLVASAFAVGCKKEAKWQYPEFTEFGAVKSMNGFVAQTDNYILFINGVGNNTSDNAYGKPVKGSLMAIKTADFTAGNLDKAEIIVPKLFVATDYTSGLFVKDGYVYYGTPSLDKNSSGKVANSEMAFFKSKIDGKANPEKLFTVNSLSYLYRISANDNGVFVVYYDESDTALKVFSESNKQISVIAKTDDKSNDLKSGDNYVSLDSYKFINNTLVYTVKVFTEKYYEEKAKQENYTRQTSYNYVYTYSIGDTSGENETFLGKKVLDGKNNTLTFALTYNKSDYVFYSETDASGNAKTYGTLITDIADTAKRFEVADSAKLADTTLIVSADEIYYADADAGYIMKSTLKKGEVNQNTERVVKTANATTLKFKLGNDIYFLNGENYLYRVELNNINANEVKITNATVNTSWYDMQTIELGEKKYLFYNNNSTLGSSYVYVVELTGEVNETDDNDNTTYFLEDSKFLGKRITEDQANVFADAVANIESVLKLDTDENGNLYSKSVNNAQAIYNNLSEEVKDLVEQSDLTKLEQSNKAVQLANAYNTLKDVKDYDKLEADKKAELKGKYESAKAVREELEKSVDADNNKDFTTIRDMLEENLKYYYQQCVKNFSNAE